jgi:hypothetical protein
MTGRSVALRVVLTTLVLSALAVTANAVVRHRANAFYTAQTLADVMAALVAVHLFGAATGRVAARRARVGGGSSPVELVGWLDWVVVALIAAFWLLAAVAYRELAGVLLIFAGAISLLAIPVRLTDGWRGASLGGRMRMKSGERRQSRRRVS